MGSTSQEILRSLCFNTDWKYAVFWKLNHRSQMVLTLEDAYYDNHVQSIVHGGYQAQDPLGLAVAKMSYHVYSLGEGIVGQIAVSGEHQWIFPEYYENSHSSFEFHSVWETQLSAGIKTILVVAVGTYGVVQLGSLRKVDEDVTLVNHIRHLFSALKDPLVDHAANLMQYNMNSSMCLPRLPSECLRAEAFPDCSGEVDKAMDVESATCTMPYSTPSYLLRMEKGAQVNSSYEVVQGSTCGSYSDVTFGFPLDVKQENQIGTHIIGDASHVGMTNDCKDPRGLDPKIHRYLKNQVLNNASSSSLAVEADRFITSQSYQGLDSNRFDGMISSGYNFPGSELLEALGSGFKQTSTDHEELVKSMVRGPTDDMSHSQLTSDTSRENLLDAVVANVCHNDDNAIDNDMLSRSVHSMLTSMELAEPSSQMKPIIDTALQVDTKQNSSDICGAFSSIGFSSTCPSSSSDQFQTSLDMPKKNKKRAKPGESSRPRPRDRQLIQDRIKELRDLVPNGSKCSIDSLLERTIKHMLFLQNVTKHADKLSKRANTKMQHKEIGMQGSSCAVEVGGHLQVCSIIVENLSKQGMVLIEMLCEECSHFLEIANVIKSLDLIILRGVTEAHGEKTWICFVVEGQNNKVIQRMDILWSLVQIFQPKANVKQ